MGGDGSDRRGNVLRGGSDCSSRKIAMRMAMYCLSDVATVTVLGISMKGVAVRGDARVI